MKQVFIIVTFTAFLFACKTKFDDYYNRPESLEPPIYQVLQSKGNFTSLLKLIDKAGYKTTLSSAGYWTLFAPHDSAFTVYFAANGINNADALDSASCRKIVTYCLVYNSFKQERISDFQSNTGWVENAAFKRRTANYTGVYNTVNTSGASIKAIASNRNNNGSLYYVDADNNNKHIPIFETGFMNGKGLTAADYNYFYPTATYSGFNVADAKVTIKDIPAENGVIHVVNKVITSLPSIDEYISSNPKYSEFKKLLDKFLVQYVLNQTVSTNYKNIYGTATDIFTKVYGSTLAFSPNNENFLKLQDNDAQADTYSMFVPENTALTNYINNVLLEHYKTIDKLPLNIVNDFVNAHMWRTAVWPTKFASTYNSVGEEARFDRSTDVTDAKVLSNGIFYGTNKVQEANVFTSVFGKVYLNPSYSIMTSLLNYDLKYQISNIRQNYTMFLVPDSVFNKAGYFFDPSVSISINEQWRYKPPAGGVDLTKGEAFNRLIRIINMLVIQGRDITDLVNPGIVMSYGGEFVKYSNNTVVCAGNGDDGTVATVTDKKTAKNGTVYYVNKLLSFSEKTVGKHLEILGGTSVASPFYYFVQFLKNSPIYNTSTGEIVSVANGSFYTFFVPNNTAIVAAVNAGLLPGTGTAPNKVPNLTASTYTAAERELVTNFIYYHILNKKNIATDGQESGTFETLFKFSNGDPSTIFVNNSVPNTITLGDMMSRSANVTLASSNNLGNRATFHLIDNYLRSK